jgi:hypothetical protein
MVTWAHAPAMTAAFLASLVEAVEALTIVLGVASGGPRSAIATMNAAKEPAMGCLDWSAVGFVTPMGRSKSALR